jgi:outer membrane protein assembly factor BamE (lipoprotein component of BamABCDE complex)
MNENLRQRWKRDCMVQTRRAVVCMAFIASASVTLTGCATGVNVTQENVSRVQRGKTTRSEVIKLFGEPQAKTVSSMGDMWMYDSTDAMLLWVGRGSARMLTITFVGDKVKDYQFTEAKTR